MADSNDTKKNQKRGSFADDLDSMLNLDETSEQQVELIDDDDAIDRLLMVDAFEEQEPSETEFNDLDKLMAEENEKSNTFSDDYDEFGDDADYFIPDFQLKPDADKPVDKDQERAAAESESASEDASGYDAPEEFDEFADAAPVTSGTKAEPKFGDQEELSGMNEIEEFGADASEQVIEADNDFLLADFDISADGAEEPLVDQELFAEPSPETSEAEVKDQGHDEFTDNELISETIDSEPDVPIVEVAESETAGQTPDTGPSQAALAELVAQIAALGAQVNDLKKQQLQFGHQIQGKGNQEELGVCLEKVETLKTEQKKVKRNVDALLSQKPVSAYIALGVAIIALLVGGGLGFQGYIAKLQLAQVAEFAGKLQEQINGAPIAEAAEKEALRKRLDELALANTTTASQVAELLKSMQSDDNNATEGLGKRLKALDERDVQMGALLESLQNKVAALDKGKGTVAAAKPVVKKAVKPAENWVVNLIAYRQDWYAARKAEEFAAQGVPAKVNKVISKGENWYRLAVDGFNSQYEAAAYAARVKKILNLDSVWVAKNK